MPTTEGIPETAQRPLVSDREGDPGCPGRTQGQIKLTHYDRRHWRGSDTVFKRVWTYPIHHAFGAFAADGDECFVAAHHTKLVSVSSHTGQVRWSATIESPWGWLAYNDRSVFYLNQHAHLIAVDRKTG